jgi:putative transposase
MRHRFLGHFDSNCYHVMSRTTGGDFLFGEAEKHLFRQWLRRLAEFTGVRVMAWCCLSNHFHLLIEVPDRDAFVRPFLDDEEKLLRHLGLIYSRRQVGAIRKEVELYRGAGHDYMADELLLKFTKRMADLSIFMKELKHRFTLAYNRLHDRKGTLWMAPFNSVLVESGAGLEMVAAYIDLNPLRAGLVDDPKDYRFCSYAEAVAGDTTAQRGLSRAMGASRNEWRLLAAQYRLRLYGEAGARSSERPDRRILSPAHIETVLAQGGRLSNPQLLRCRLRYFTDGGIIGSRAFLENYLRQARWRFGPRRLSAARDMRGGDWQNLCVVRDLQREPIISS